MGRTRCIALGALAGLILVGIGSGPASARVLSEAERQFLLRMLPDNAKGILPDAEALVGAGRTLIADAASVLSRNRCNGVVSFTSLGSALQGAARSLQKLEPMLIEKGQVDLVGLFEGDPRATNQVAENLRRVVEYRNQLNKISQAGRELQNVVLDSAGVGSLSKAGGLLAPAGAALGDLDEDSGIGLHLKHVGEILGELATARTEGSLRICADALKLTGQMVVLAGENLVGTAMRVLQVGARRILGLPLETVGASLERQEAPPWQIFHDLLTAATALYRKVLLEQAASLMVRAAVARESRPPQAPAQSAFQDIAVVLGRQADVVDQAAATVVQGEEALKLAAPAFASGATQDIGRTLRAVGTSFGQTAAIFRQAGVGSELEATGAALRRAGDYLISGNLSAAGGVLRDIGARLTNVGREIVTKD